MSSNASSRAPRGKAAAIAAGPLQGDARNARPPNTPRTVAPKSGAPVRDVPSGKRSSQVVWSSDRNGNGSARRPSLGPSAKPNSPPVSAKAAAATSSAPSYSGPPGPSRDAALRARPKATHEHINFNRSASPPGSGRRHSLSMGSSTGLVVSANASSPRTTMTLASSSGLAGAAASSSDAAADAEREGSNVSSPRRRQSEVAAPAKPPPAKKRGNSSKKRRQTGNSTTRPQPFSFSTDIRKGRRVRPTSVDEELSTEDVARPNPRMSKSRFSGPKYSSIVQVPVPKRHGAPLTPPDSGVSQGGASSSSDHWEPQSPGLPTSASASTPAVSSGEPTTGSMPSSASTSRLLAARLERPPPHLVLPGRDRSSERRVSGSHEDETPSPGTQGQNSFSHAGGNSSSSSSHTRGRHHYQGPERRASSRDASTTRDGNASSTEDFWPFSPMPPSSSPAASPNPVPTKLGDKRGSRRSRVTMTDLRKPQHYQSGGGQQPGPGLLSASSSANSSIGVNAGEDASASVSEPAGAAALTRHHSANEEEDRGGSSSRERSNSASGSLERNRSTSILRGRFNAHISRAQAAAEVEDRERHVSFCADRSNEVVQFSVERNEPATTRVARRVFGGDLQVNMTNATSTRYQVGTGLSFDGASRAQPTSGAAMSGLPNGAMSGGRMPSVERLGPNVLEYARFKDGENRPNAYLRPGIRDLAQPPAETGPAH